MEPTRTRTLEVTVISGEDLYLDRNPVTENAYVAVRPESIKSWSTKMEKGSAGHVSWKEKLMVEMPLHAKSITLEVKCKSSKGMVKSVGVARIAIPEVAGEDGEALSYRLMNWEGRRSGVINFSVRRAKIDESQEKGGDKPMMLNSCVAFTVKPQLMEVHMNLHRHHINARQNNGPLLGIPVCWNGNEYNHGVHV